jgi:PAS domain S-box-containing protein
MGDEKETNPDGILTRQPKQSGTGTDITEREKAGEAVKKSEEYFRAITENILDIIIIVDKKGVINYISPSIECFVGYKPEEIVGKSAFNFIHPADLPRAAVDFAKAIITKETNIPNSFHVRHKDGSERILEGLGKNLLDNPAVAGFVMNVRDVTERKKAEEALHFTQFALDNAVEEMVCVSQDARYIDANDAFCRAVGYSREELLLMTAHDIDPNYSAEIWSEFWEKLKRSGSLTFESCHRRRDGKVFPVEVTVTFFEYQGKEYHCGFAHDITERKKMEEELRENEKKWTSLTENTNDIVMIVDDKGKIRYINKTLPPYTPKETVGKSVYEYVPKEQHDTMRNSLTKVFKTGKPEAYEVPSVIPKLGTIWFSTKVVHIKIKENIVSAILISTDITERKQAEKALKDSEEGFRILYSTSRDALMTLEPPSSRFTAGNPATVEMFRTKDEKEFTSMPPWELSPEYQPDGQLSSVKANKMIEEAMEKGSNFFEWVHRRADGEDFPATVLLTRAKLKSKEFLQATVRDITKQKKAEHALKESEEKHREIVENINDVLFTINNEGIMRYISPQVKDLFGYEPDEIIGKHFSEFVYPDDLKKLISLFKDILAGKHYPSDYRINHKSGRPVWVRSSSRPVLKDGKIVGIRGRLTDITKEKGLELEKDALHIKAKESLVMIQKQNIQLINLQKKLKSYANKLETKVKKLEEAKLNLTDKEKRVFYALVACPDMNDRELAEQTGLKRSTVTAIKNRLKEEKLYEEINMPDLAALGCGLMTVIYGKFDMEYGEIRRMREKVMSSDVVFAHTTDTGVFAITATKDLVSFHKDIGPSITFATKAKAFKDYPSIAHFPLELSIIQEFFNFAPALRESFSMTENLTQKPVQGNPERQPLNKNAKEILYALVKHPEASTVELAKMLRLTRATVSRIKSDLFRQGLVKKLIMPDIKRLNYAFSAVYHFKHVPGMTADIFKKILHSFKAQDPIAHIVLMGAMESMGGMLFRDGREHAEFMSRLIREMKAEGLVTEDPAESILQIQETKQFMFSFAPITKKMLGIENEI